ncbi:acyl-CoA thioesterase/BAAT N-terminal domain-containing protein [Pseudonocardia kunmingensis]|nr:acyl-CoA thioester hydrolase/BAAT C-terminal domain-containing protein [Pseudonocardia kunmingensis]
MMIALGSVLALLAVGCSAPAPDGPQIIAGPDGASIAEPVRIVVDGLAPGDPVRVWARANDRMGQWWESSAELTADGTGSVDLTSAESTGGTYQGVDPAGLFWSMRLPDDRAAPVPLAGADDVVVELGVDRDGTTIARSSLRREVRAPDARPIAMAEPGLVGDLYLPAGSGPWPGVLLLGGAEGGRPDPAYAALLANQGFAVLGLAYFGEPRLPTTLTRVPVEYGLSAARWLAERPEVTGPRVGVIGSSRGAEYALLLASSEPDRFGAVVAHAPSDVVWPAPATVPGARRVSSWTREGEDVPFLPLPAGEEPAPEQPVRTAASYAEAVEDAGRWARTTARIPVEDITAPVLLTSGGDDGVWPSTAQAQRAMAAIDAAGNPFGSRHLDFPSAGHPVGGVPNMPTSRTAVPVGPVVLETGGNPAATAGAVRHTFAATLDVLHALTAADG